MNRRPRPTLPLPLFILLSFFTLVPSAGAQPVPTVSKLAPASLNRGQSVDITVDGAGLANVNQIGIADGRGVRIELVPSPTDAQLKLKVTAAADAVPGEREFRLVAPTGVSAPLKVSVEQYPAVAEAEPNDAPDKAQAVQVPAVIVGAIGAAGDSDLFKISATKGQTLVVNVFAARLRSPLDANVILYDPAGKEVASNNDANGTPDPFLAYEVPADGAYTLELRDLQYRGGGDYAYRVEAGPIPYLTALEPMAGRRGTVMDVRLKGYNLGGGGADRRQLDLTFAQPGRIGLRAQAPGGPFSNELPFDVTELPPAVETEPNDAAAQATAVEAPADVTGLIGKPGDVDFFRLRVARKGALSLEVMGRRLGSPLDALLTLHDKDGNAIDRNDDAAGADARIAREVEPGEYLASVRDLAFAGGPDYVYRLSLEPAAPSAAPGVPQDFFVRFLPDAARVSRGSATKLWCEVVRVDGFKGDVSVALEGLPPGVTAGPVVMGEGHSGVVSLSAAPDAALGSFPIALRATASVNGRLVTRTGEPELNGARVDGAYLTVLDAAPFTVAPVATLPPDRVAAFAGEIAGLVGKMSSQSQQLAAQQAEWEKRVAAAPPWTTLTPVQLGSRERGTFAQQPDGSILATAPTPEADVYNLTFTTDVKGIAALRLELLTDPALPNQGPGRANNGNFVLHELKVTAAPKADPAKAQPVVLQKARATFSQQDFDVAKAVDNNPGTGWAISPETSKNHSAVFFTAAPVGFDGGTTFTVAMEQNFTQQHVIGKFRLSVTTDAAAADAPPVPDAIRAIVATPLEKRTPEQRAQIAEYYRSIDPSVAADRARLDVLRNVVAPYAEVARLEAALSQQTPELDAAQAAWEQSLAAGAGWTPLDFAELKSANGTTLIKEPDGSAFASGAAPPQDTYTLVANTPLKGITAIRVEALPDPRLPGNGPGRNGDGNFLLTDVKATIAPAGKPAEAKPLELASAKASHEQGGTSAAAMIDDKPDTGWGIHPQLGRPHAATFYAKAPAGGDGGNRLTLTLAHSAPVPGLTLGRFRAYATTAPAPDAIAPLPQYVRDFLKVPAAERNDAQKAALAGYYRSVAPSLDPVRRRLDELRAALPPFPVVAYRNVAGSIPVFVNRNNFPGDVTVTLEGFQSGREGNGPANIAKSLKVAPLMLNAGATLGVLTFQVEGGAEGGTKLAVLRAEAKVGNDTVIQYSPAFPITVQ